MSTPTVNLPLTERPAPDDYVKSIRTGFAFYRVSESHRSADQMGYYPMVQNLAYSNVVASLARAAAIGDFYASAVHLAACKISPYLNGHQIVAAIATAFSKVVIDGWHDTRTASGPEPGRPSTHQHETTLHQAIVLMLLVHEIRHGLTDLGQDPRPGWALQAMVREEEVETPHAYSLVLPYLPQVASDLGR